ncbi:MAG TPA: peptide chain release factor N(5)-glutamine methyltransferase [Opitutaceae bacterium]|jgi:release factor glutamine methyltransferase|nr:peptide chain release factor N(5)-glutamine methyltransferase [Opitutaceae bacterium]HPO00961.1 peptide chain release factor N(5)-glutamine methyltransferase [Opitutaceae bacterium]
MHTVLDILQKTTDFFSGKGVESARLNAELIVGHALGLKRMQLYLQFERLLTEPELERIRPLVRRRGQREPLAYVLGTAEFCGLTLKADRRALVPRPETERLVELLQERCVPAPARVLDLGTGTGCIALALASAWPGAEVVAVDASEEALALARENGESTGLAARVRWLKSDWFSGLPVDARFDLIVSNPPYLTAEETAAAEPEVRTYEPASALTAAEAGMADLRKIIAGAPRFLAPGGWLAMETGIAQHAALLADLARAGLHDGESVKDLADRDRFVVARAG